MHNVDYSYIGAHDTLSLKEIKEGYPLIYPKYQKLIQQLIGNQPTTDFGIPSYDQVWISGGGMVVVIEVYSQSDDADTLKTTLACSYAEKQLNYGVHTSEVSTAYGTQYPGNNRILGMLGDFLTNIKLSKELIIQQFQELYDIIYTIDDTEN